MMHYYYNNPGYWFLGSLFHILLWILVIWLIIAIVRHFRGGRGSWRDMMHDAPWKKSALDILKERYAKGEIKKEEFEAMKKDIM